MRIYAALFKYLLIYSSSTLIISRTYHQYIYTYIYIYIYIYMYIYYAIRHMLVMYGNVCWYQWTKPLVHWYQRCITVHNVPKCMSYQKAIVMIAGRVHCFRHCIYITLILLHWNLSFVIVVDRSCLLIYISQENFN